MKTGSSKCRSNTWKISTIAYNHLLNHPDGYKVKPKFYVGIIGE